MIKQCPISGRQCELSGCVGPGCSLQHTTAQEPYGYVYTVNGTYTLFSDKKPPDDAYDEGTLVAVAAIRGEEKK